MNKMHYQMHYIKYQTSTIIIFICAIFINAICYHNDFMVFNLFCYIFMNIKMNAILIWQLII